MPSFVFRRDIDLEGRLHFVYIIESYIFVRKWKIITHWCYYIPTTRITIYNT